MRHDSAIRTLSLLPLLLSSHSVSISLSRRSRLPPPPSAGHGVSPSLPPFLFLSLIPLSHSRQLSPCPPSFSYRGSRCLHLSCGRTGRCRRPLNLFFTRSAVCTSSCTSWSKDCTATRVSSSKSSAPVERPFKSPTAEGRRRKAEGRRRKAEGQGPKGEGERPKAEGRRAKGRSP